jgi:hypothetical protein
MQHTGQDKARHARKGYFKRQAVAIATRKEEKALLSGLQMAKGFVSCCGIS